MSTPLMPTNLSPSNGKIINVGQANSFTWQDSGEQAAYYIEYIATATGVIGWSNTGWVTSATASHSFAAGSFADATKYSWRVRVRNANNEESYWSEPAAFEGGYPKDIEITYPEDDYDTVDELPLYEHAFNSPEGYGQAKYQYQVYTCAIWNDFDALTLAQQEAKTYDELEIYGATAIYDSGEITGDETSLQQPPGYLLTGTYWYKVRVKVTDSHGTLFTSDFRTFYILIDSIPKTPTITATADGTNGRNTIAIVNPAPDAGQVGVSVNKVYRYRNSAWEFLDDSTLTIGTFTRSSTAYNNGVEVVANTPRYETGLYGNGVLIEEATTNILTANQSSVETDLTGITALGSVTLTRDTSIYWNGSACAKVVTNGVAGSEGLYISKTGMTLVVGETYTASAWVKGSGNIKLYLREYGSVQYQSSTTTVALTSSWQRISVTITIQDAANTALMLLYCTSGTQAVTFYGDGFQIEKKAYATSWMIGGTARVKDSLSIPTTDVFDKTSFNVEFVFTPTCNPASGSSKALWEYRIGANDEYLIYVTSTGILYARAKSGGASVTSDAFGPLVLGTPCKISFGANGTIIRLCADGSQVGTDKSYTVPVGTTTTMQLGMSTAWASANGIFEDLRISSTIRTLAEHQSYVSGGVAHTYDAYTTALLNLNNNISNYFAIVYDTTCRSGMQETYCATSVGTNGVEGGQSSSANATCTLTDNWFTNLSTGNTIRCSLDAQWGQMQSEREREENWPYDEAYPMVLYGSRRFYRGDFQAAVELPDGSTWDTYMPTIEAILDAGNEVLFRTIYGDTLKVDVYDFSFQAPQRFDLYRNIKFKMVELEEIGEIPTYTWDTPPSPIDGFWVIDPTTGKGMELMLGPEWDDMVSEKDRNEMVGIGSLMPDVNYGNKKCYRSGFSGYLIASTTETCAEMVKKFRELVDAKTKKSLWFKTVSGDVYLVDVYNFSYELFDRFDNSRKVSFDFIEVGVVS